jgi:hypothetical protein
MLGLLLIEVAHIDPSECLGQTIPKPVEEIL